MLEFYQNYILFNFFSFGTLLVTIFTGLFAFFFLTLPNKSQSTFHLGVAFLFLTIFNFGYFIAAAVYHPISAYHRWLTGCFILPSLLHFGQFFFKYPRDSHPSIAKKFLYCMWFVAIVASVLFMYNTLGVEKKFHFTGHYWDFDAEGMSKLLGVLIATYSVITFLGISIWKIYITNGKEKKVLIQISIAMLIAAITPNITNILSRDGIMDRSTYLLSLVLFFVVGFFVISLVYINSTKDRTTFMVKIVGLTMVTILLILQASTFFSMKDKDSDYDSLRQENILRIIDGGDKYKDAKYIIQLELDSLQIKKVDYNDDINLDLPHVEVDFRNTAIYDDIKNLNEKKFAEKIESYLFATTNYFDGFKHSILHFVKNNLDKKDAKLKELTLNFMQDLNQESYVHRNKIYQLNINSFCTEYQDYLVKKKLVFFKKAIDKEINNCKWFNKEISNKELRSEVLKYFRNFKPSMTRHYRRSKDLHDNQVHYVSYIHYNQEKKILSEVGYSYTEYRKYIHHSANVQQLILIFVVLIIFQLFPLFFKSSLINPLWDLVSALEKVNMGDMEVEVPIKVNDEIGFLSESFNSMVISIRFARSELKLHAITLEEKVKSRTKQVEEQMDEVNKLKLQQDGDYFLTSLLAKPLLMNANKSDIVKTDFIIKQKKRFEFKSKNVELGGDICITGNLRLGTKNNHKRYTMAMNADAMGKSMQGAGGALVMGVVMNSIMARSAAKDWILDRTPIDWLTDVYYEIHKIFKAFNGSMVISTVVMLVDEEDGIVYYFNAEHPFSVIFRNGKAQFIEDKLNLRKLGLDSEIPFQVFQFELEVGDVIIIGSDGRDDIDLSPNEPVRNINEDESLFLEHVIVSDGNIEKTLEVIQTKGELIDDFSLLRIGYKESSVDLKEKKNEIIEEPIILNEEFLEKETVYTKAKEFIKSSKEEEAKFILAKYFLHSEENQSDLKINKLLALLSFQFRDYELSSIVIKKYLEVDPNHNEFLYYLSIAEKKLGNFEPAIDFAERLKNLSPEHSLNLLNLADLNRILGLDDKAITLTRKVLEIEPDNKTAKRLLASLES